MGLMLFIIGFAIVAVLFICAVKLIINWIEGRTEYENTIKFEDLKKYYNKNPKPWILDNDSVCYLQKNGRYSYQMTTQRFSFSFIDYIKYMWWRLGVESDKAKKENEAILAQIEQDYHDKEN
jgi:hypothetical protein